jgi:hypothetical protein
MPYTIGLNWGGTTHAVCVTNAAGAVALPSRWRTAPTVSLYCFDSPPSAI